MAKYMNKIKTMRHILSFSAEPILRLTCQKIIFQISFCDRNFIISNISIALMKLKKLWPNLQIN